MRQFIQMLRCHGPGRGTSESNVRDTSNALRTLVYSNVSANSYGTASAPANNATYGPVVGTGTPAVSINDFALAAQIAEGTGPGQMEHGAVSVSSVVVAGNTASYTVSRVFTNSSGGLIVVYEHGLYVDHDDTSFANRQFCIARDLIAGGQVVAHGQTITVEYKISVTAG